MRRPSSRPECLNTDLIAEYLVELGIGAPLSSGQVQDLLAAWRSAEVVPNRLLIKPYIKMVVSVAKLYHKPGIKFVELIAQGNTGLLEAIRRFEPSYDNDFHSYSLRCVERKIRDAVLKKALATGT